LSRKSLLAQFTARLPLLVLIALVPLAVVAGYLSANKPAGIVIALVVVGTVLMLVVVKAGNVFMWRPFGPRVAAKVGVTYSHLHNLVEGPQDIIYVYRLPPDAGYEYISRSITDVSGYTPDEYYADPQLAIKLVHPDDQAKFTDALEGRSSPSIELRWIRKDGSVIWVEQQHLPILDSSGRRIAIEAIARDISARKHVESELDLLQNVTVAVSESKDLETALKVVLSLVCQATGWAIGQAWIPRKEDNILTCSPAWFSREPGLEGLRLESENQSVSLAGDSRLAQVARNRVPVWLSDLTQEHSLGLKSAVEAGFRTALMLPVFFDDTLEAVIEFYRREPAQVDNHLMRTVASAAAQLGAVVKRSRSEELVSYLAQYDPVTGLPNRALFADRLRQGMFQASRHNRLVGVAFLDIDRFKTINDSMGHDTGDALLRAIGQRLRECLRDGDTVARAGGDEFIMVLADMAHTDDAARLAHKILTHLRRPFTVGGHEFYVSGSLGITFYPHDARDVEELLRNADVAMYRAKEMGRNTFQFYAAEMMAQAQERLNLENSLRRALERGEFALHYQPIVELEGGKIVGAEALLRWRHPERGMVPPGKFIPFAEESGLIVPIGEWVLRTACAQAREWEKAGFGKLRVSVNISPRQFQRPDVFNIIANALRDTKLAPECLELELTESMLMLNPEAAIANMKRLSGMGVQLSIDDFGTGYSSLSYLKRFPIDRLKIDRTFVSGVPKDTDDVAIVAAIIAMAHKLGMNVVAEGVETADQLSYLRNNACDVMQGYYFSPAVPNEEFTALLQVDRSLPLPPRTEAPGLH
jgi:diguanylate cyclase (GGDEF)-like protein/PAS domain S-box-containing protein